MLHPVLPLLREAQSLRQREGTAGVSGFVGELTVEFSKVRVMERRWEREGDLESRCGSREGQVKTEVTQGKQAVARLSPRHCIECSVSLQRRN